MSFPSDLFNQLGVSCVTQPCRGGVVTEGARCGLGVNRLSTTRPRMWVFFVSVVFTKSPAAMPRCWPPANHLITRWSWTVAANPPTNESTITLTGLRRRAEFTLGETNMHSNYRNVSSVMFTVNQHQYNAECRFQRHLTNIWLTKLWFSFGVTTIAIALVIAIAKR